MTPAHDVITWHAEAARASENSEQWATALAHLERLAALDPERPNLAVRMGRAREKQGK
jgi:hypothetical protein